MSNLEIFLMMGEIFLGFLCMMGAFVSFMYKKSMKQVWILVAFAFFFLTVLPVTQAIGSTWMK